MQPEPAESRWQQWGRILFLGVLLGVLQLLVLLAAPLLAQGFQSLWSPILVSAFFYLLISAIAGFMAADRRGTISSGILDACLVGGVNVLSTAILGSAAILAGSNAQQPVCSNCAHPFLVNPAYFIQGLITFILIFEGISALVGGILGGWIGGLLAQRQAAASQSSGEDN